MDEFYDMKLSVVILNYNMRGLLTYCLKSLHRHPSRQQTELIVVDNASVDGSRVRLKEWEQSQPFEPLPISVTYRAQNQGYAVGNNEGIRAATGEYILILNPDIAVLPSSIDRMVDYLDRHPSVAVVGPKLLNPDKSLQHSCYRFPSMATPLYRRTILGNTPWGRNHVRSYMMMDWDHDSEAAVDWIMGSAMMLRRSAIEHVGGLDEQFFMYFEDIDWCRRFWLSGYEVHYLGSAVMVHYHQRLSADTGVWALRSWATRTHIASAIRYFTKYASHEPIITSQQVSTKTQQQIPGTTL